MLKKGYKLAAKTNLENGLLNRGWQVSESLWNKCLDDLQHELKSQDFNTWILPLQSDFSEGKIRLFAPNQYVYDHINDRYLQKIQELVVIHSKDRPVAIALEVGAREVTKVADRKCAPSKPISDFKTDEQDDETSKAEASLCNFNPAYTFDNFVVGSSNTLAQAVAMQVGDNPGGEYNPLFLYGGVGLGKTHLLHAIGNSMRTKKPNALVLYLHSERFVAHMVKAIQTNSMDEFKDYYRKVDALMIDDIQFFAGKDRSQEEFFHTFNALLEAHQQVILTCDRYPKEINGLEERLKSRFGWGLTVAIEPPELETRVAILLSKAEQANITLPYEAAFFIAKRIRSNVRELEGALKRVVANAHFTGKPITLDFIKEALKDLLALHDKLVTIENIQKTVAEYYKIKLADLLSKRRNRSIALPRQMAMALAKQLTNHSLPEIGDAFGGRDHTTVLHACRKIKNVIETNVDLKEDYTNLLRILSS